MKTLNGKAIYSPKGAAGEYAQYACNFYNGCSNNCSYCYLKKGVLKKTLGGNHTTLKKCFKDEDHALAIFEKELVTNKEALQKHGIFFSFTTDPMLPETIDLTWSAMAKCIDNGISVKILTKRTDWVTWQRLEIYTNEGCRDLKKEDRKKNRFWIHPDRP
jgi:DNA repair photolyase